jgi:DNA-binding transcriptional regulator YhcF (GntR family)
VDRELLKSHRIEFSYHVGRFMVEHLARVHRQFDGDLAMALVLGTIGQYNASRFFEQVAARSDEPTQELYERGEHLPHLKACNASSVSASTGIPRETVRRKIRRLIEMGFVQQVGRDKLFITQRAADHFVDFDAGTMERMMVLIAQVQAIAERRRAEPRPRER